MPWYPKIVTVKKDGTRGSEYPFPTGRCSVGGIAGCDIHIRGAGSSHCLFIVDKNQQAHVVNVTGSADVKHNGEDVDNESFLGHGDIVQIGPRQFRFEWVEKRKKEESSKVAAASHQPKAAGDARESSTLHNEIDNEAHHVEQSNGTPGACTPTAYSFDQSLFKTPRIPPEMFVSPLSATDSDGCNGDKGGPGTDALGNSQHNSSSSSTPLIDEPRIRALHSSTSSTPLIDEPRTRTTRSRSSLVGMVNSFREQEHSAFQERQSYSSLKRKSQSHQCSVEEGPSKLRRSDSCGHAQRTPLACHSNANGQSGPSSRSSSTEGCAAHIDGSTLPGTSAQFFAASTPVTRAARNSRLRSDKSLKGISFSHQEKNSGFVTPGSQSSYPNGNATTDESFLDSPGLSRRALRSSRASLSHTSLSSSADSLGCESLFKTPSHTDSISKTELGPLTAQDISNCSLGNKRVHKRLSHVANESSQQSQAKSFTASPMSSRSRHSLEKNTNGAQTPSDHSARSTRANSSLGQNSESTSSVKRVVTADETISSFDGSNCEGQFGASTLGFLEQEEGVSAKKTGSKRAISTDSTSSFKESPGDKGGTAEVSSRAARSSITNSAVDSPTWVELGSEGLLQGVFCVSADDSKRVTRSTRLSHTPNQTPASNNKSKKASPEQEGAVACEEGDDEEEGVPVQSAREMSQSDQESLEHMGIVAESPKVTVSKQTIQTLENSRESALEKATLLTRSGRFSHTPTSKEMREEVSELEATGTASALKAPTSRRTLRSSNVSEEMNRAVSTLSPGHMTLDDVDAAVKGFNKRTRSARFSHELVSRKADEKASEHKRGGMSPTLQSSGAQQALISKKGIEGMLKQKTAGTPKSLKALAARQVPRSSEVNEKEAANTLLSKRMSSQNMGVALEESFGCTRSTRSSCTPASVSPHVEKLEQQIEGTPVAVKGTKGKQTAVSKLAFGGVSKQKRDSAVLGGEKTPTLLKADEERSPEQETLDMQTSKTLSSPKSDCTPASRSGDRGTPGPDEVGSQDPMGGSETRQAPVSRKNKALTSETLNTPKSSKALGSKRTPASGKIDVSNEATEEGIVGTPAAAECAPFMSTGSVMNESFRRSARSSCTPVLEQEPNTESIFNPLEASMARQSIPGNMKSEADTPKFQKVAGVKRTSAAKMTTQERGDLKQTTRASSAKRVSFDDTCVVVEGFVRSTRSSLSSASRNVNAATPGMEEVCSQNVMGDSIVSRRSKEALAQETVDTPKSLKTSGGKQTPASSKMSASEEATEQDIMGTSPVERSPLMSISPVVAESVGTQSTRSSRTPTLKNSSKEAPGDETVGLTPNSLKASGQKKAVSRKVSNETPQQEMADTPNSLKASAAKRTSASKKIIENQGDLKQTTLASPSECVSFDNTSAATEGFVRSTRPSLSSASRNVNAVTPGMEEVCLQNVMGASRVSRRSKEALAQEKVDTPKSLKTSGGKQTPASSKISASEEATEQDIMGTSSVERSPLMSISPVVAESVGTQSTRSSRTPTVKNSSKEAPGDEIVGLAPNSLKASGQKKAVSRKVNNETPQQEMADTPKSLKASAAKRISASKKIIEDQGDLKQTTRASPSECVSFDNTSAATEGFVRSTRSSLSSASRNVNAVTPGMEEVGSQNVMGASRVSRRSKEALAQETVDTPKSLKTSGRKQTPASSKISASEEATEQNIMGASPVESPKYLEASTAQWASPAKNVVEEDLEQETGASPSKQVFSNNTCVVSEESVRPTRSGRTPASRNIITETPGQEEVHLQEATRGSGAKRPAVSRKNKKASAQKPVGTPKSSKALGVKQVQPSDEVIADGGTLEQDTAGMAPDEYVTFDNTDSAVEASDRTRSIRSSQTSSNEGKLKVTEKEKEATAGSNQKPSSKPSRAKRTPTSKRATAADVATELEKAGMSPLQHVAFDNTDGTAAASGRATRAARPKYAENDKRTDVKMPRQEAECTVSPLKALEAAQTLASNKELGESPKLEAVDTKKTSRKILQAKTARSRRKVNEGEEVPELETAGVSPSKCSSATHVHALADEPARPTRGCRTRGSRKDNVEAPEEKEVDHPQSTKATRAKHTQGSRKVCKKDETLQDVAGSSLVTSSTTQRKDATFDKHLQGELSPTKEVSVTRNTRGKRKVDLKKESIAEKQTTAEELIGTVAEKRGRRQQRVASAEDAQNPDSTEQIINPKITRQRRANGGAKKAPRNKEVVDDAPASPNVEEATVETASTEGKVLATTMEPKRSKRKMAAVKVDMAQTATEATPRKTRGRRAKALETVIEWADDKPDASRRTAKDHSEEVPLPKRTRKKV
ncbi:uncharacterized protein LOC144113032 [Amblyomma americanum]